VDLLWNNVAYPCREQVTHGVRVGNRVGLHERGNGDDNHRCKDRKLHVVDYGLYLLEYWLYLLGYV
jgi:hypothetical protein